MSVLIALCGNEAVEKILSDKLRLLDTARVWQVRARSIQVSPKPAEPELYAEPMLKLARERAARVLAATSAAQIGVAFEHSTVKTAIIVDLIPLRLTEMDTEELASSETLEKIRAAEIEANKYHEPRGIVSVAVVVDARGSLLDCVTIEPNGLVKVTFTWDDGMGRAATAHAECVNLSGRIPNHAALVLSLRDALIEYHRILKVLP